MTENSTKPVAHRWDARPVFLVADKARLFVELTAVGLATFGESWPCARFPTETPGGAPT